MPFHFTYDEIMKKSLLADYINCAPGRNCGSSTAATFLKLFADDANFLHLDIAGSSEIKTKKGSEPLPVMLRTLFNFSKNNFYRCEFLKTKLTNVDFSDSNIEGIIFDNYSLKGIIIEPFQSASIVGMLGVNFKDLKS